MEFDKEKLSDEKSRGKKLIAAAVLLALSFFIAVIFVLLFGSEYSSSGSSERIIRIVAPIGYILISIYFFFYGHAAHWGVRYRMFFMATKNSHAYPSKFYINANGIIMIIFLMACIAATMFPLL